GPIHQGQVVYPKAQAGERCTLILQHLRHRPPLADKPGGIIQGLEEALEGREAGDTFSATVTPDKAYGPRKADAIQRVPIKHLMGAKRWKPGMIAQVKTEQGPRHVIVAKVGLKFADVDNNHPMAGKTLTFDIEIIEVRAASPEEISHGHAHGPGGHH
ncbi:hypothetical protein LCGC14_1033720, partial [marine sediment metagenome]